MNPGNSGISREVGPSIDWGLLVRDLASGALFGGGTIAILTGGQLVGIVLWTACLALDWATLAHVRTVRAAGLDPAAARAFRQYVRFRVATTEVADALVALTGFWLASRGGFAAGAAILGLAAGGFAFSRLIAAEGNAAGATGS